MHSELKTGILLLAMGHKYYAEMACNLAMCLRVGAPDVDITLAWHGFNPKDLPPAKQKLFNQFVEIPTEYVMKKGNVRYFRVKTLLPHISPYDNTLYMDVDVVWFNKPITDLFYQFDKIDFTSSNWGGKPITKGDEPNSVWADTAEIADAYNLWGKTYAPFHSELMWFKKTNRVLNFFEVANAIFDEPKVKVFTYAGDVPDEFAFNVASALMEVYPHQMPWRPVWWYNFAEDKKIAPERVIKEYLGMSMAGNFQNDRIISRYNAIVKYAAQKAGIVNYWKYVPKRRWAVERATV